MSLNLKRRCQRRLGLPLCEYLRRCERYRIDAPTVAEILSASVRLVLWWCDQYGIRLGARFVRVGNVVDTPAKHIRRAGVSAHAVRYACECGYSFAEALWLALYRKALRVGGWRT